MKDTTAILLCGGKGVRLRPLTQHLPKSMVVLRGRPILQHLLQFLSDSGVKRFVICTGYMSEVIENFIKKEKKRDWVVEIVNSGDASMTDRILDALPHVEGRALICYGDTLANLSLAELKNRHEKSKALATLSVHPLNCPFGVVSFDDKNRIIKLEEKPVLPHWINIGFMLCEKKALSLISRGQEMTDFFAALQSSQQFFCYPHNGKHLTVNTENELANAEKEIVDFYTVTEEAA